MSWTSLQMISLGSLLLFGDRPLCAGSSQCITDDQFNRRLEKLQRWRDDSGPPERSPDLAHRSISPWTYEEDINKTRHPDVIYKAKCRYSGCIIDGAESNAYNSVEVTALMKVLYKSAVLCAHNPRKHRVTERWIRVPVACTCVRPKY